MKTCKDCQLEQDETNFYASKEGYLSPRCKPCHNKYSVEWAKSNPEKVAAHRRKKKLKDKYGVSLHQYQEMLLAQGGVCAICGGTSKRGRPLDVDHCHVTGKIRGLLCDLCNKAIGMFYDDPVQMKKAITYLETYA